MRNDVVEIPYDDMSPELLPPALEAILAAGALDVLVLDALQKKRHTTHFSLEQAVEAAARIGARQTWFTHIAHGLSHAATNAELPRNMQLAHDGLLVSSRS